MSSIFSILHNFPYAGNKMVSRKYGNTTGMYFCYPSLTMVGFPSMSSQNIPKHVQHNSGQG
ncbi:hypothetical protein DN53_15880 [Flagellimonas olearia]|uniref:Uncharacterized protein n=1 Tax=Flagellimonas olearia TaxID=552546 RepID=A0A444VK77_9FLAO|nr:hypothetical protein DN53_15880 [Allomuricauda olearia]